LAEKKILIIDDDRGMRALVATIFSRNGTEIIGAHDGRQGLREFFNIRPDLVLLDQMMPTMSGFEVLQRIRELSDVPVIMLSVINHHDEVVRCLSAGADDYISKPFETQVLIARVDAALRRAARQKGGSEVLVYDDGYLMFDIEARIVKVANIEVRLSATEFELLSFFARRPGRVSTFSQIFENVWGDSVMRSAENVHTFIYQLRQKLEPDPQNPTYFISLRGTGYRFQLVNGD
jgi:DNA-binding response OmpR family regulator